MSDEFIEAVAKKMVTAAPSWDVIERAFKPQTAAALLLRSDYEGTTSIIFKAIQNEFDHTTLEALNSCWVAIDREKVYRETKHQWKAKVVSEG